jgi:hypothetical protein
MVELDLKHIEVLVDDAGVDEARDVTVGIEDDATASEIFDVILERRRRCDIALLKLPAQ